MRFRKTSLPDGFYHVVYYGTEADEDHEGATWKVEGGVSILLFSDALFSSVDPMPSAVRVNGLPLCYCPTEDLDGEKANAAFSLFGHPVALAERLITA